MDTPAAPDRAIWIASSVASGTRLASHSWKGGMGYVWSWGEGSERIHPNALGYRLVTNTRHSTCACRSLTFLGSMTTSDSSRRVK